MVAPPFDVTSSVIKLFAVVVVRVTEWEVELPWSTNVVPPMGVI